MRRAIARLASLAAVLALVVIVFGAFVRLSNAGLSCPDWPTCYGRVTWPAHADEVVDHGATTIRAVDLDRAWREQVHRMLAGGLGLLVLALALLSARRQRGGVAGILMASALAAAAIPVTMAGLQVPAAALFIGAEAILIGHAVRARDDLARLGGLTLAVVIFQAVLGMWTVTWLLQPLVVMAHLIGGLLTASLLVLLAWRAADWPLTLPSPASRRAIAIGLALVVAQIVLGGWTSANYAAFACGTEYPTCLGALLPPADFREGFVLTRAIGVDYEGGVLDGPARVAIHVTHRTFALVLLAYVLGLAAHLAQPRASRGTRALAGALALAVLAQVALGIANVTLALPLAVAVAHSAGAALVLLLLVTLLARSGEARFVGPAPGAQ